MPLNPVRRQDLDHLDIRISFHLLQFQGDQITPLDETSSTPESLQNCYLAATCRQLGQVLNSAKGLGPLDQALTRSMWAPRPLSFSSIAS